MNATPAGAEPRICFVGPGNLPALAPEYWKHGVGGMEMQQSLLARALARRGFNVTMATGDFGQPDGATWDGVKTFRTYSRGEGLPIIRFIHPRWTSMWSALKRANADIYYVSGAGMLLGLVTMFARRYRRKVIFYVASNTDCDPGTLRVRLWRDRKLYEYGLRRADVVLSQTPEQQQMLLNGGYHRRSVIVPSLVETARQCLPLAERDVDVLWVGGMRPLKRPHLFLDMARQLPQFRFEMAGGPFPLAQDFFAQVKQEAAALPNLTFHGRVSDPQIRSLFERARVLAGTSEVEGFPTIYLQAWSHGAPVVAYLDPEELIATHGLGQVISNPQEMKTALHDLLTDEAKWHATSERCRNYAARRLDENATLAPYLSAIASLIPPRRPDHPAHASTVSAAR